MSWNGKADGGGVIVELFTVTHVTVVPVYGGVDNVIGGLSVDAGVGSTWNTYISVVMAWKMITVDNKKMYQYLSAAWNQELEELYVYKKALAPLVFLK